jgi:hypothetical protein
MVFAWFTYFTEPSELVHCHPAHINNRRVLSSIKTTQMKPPVHEIASQCNPPGLE